jgi:hypothetical protein
MNASLSGLHRNFAPRGLFKLREQAAFDDLTGVLRRAAGISAARDLSPDPKTSPPT